MVSVWSATARRNLTSWRSVTERWRFAARTASSPRPRVAAAGKFVFEAIVWPESGNCSRSRPATQASLCRRTQAVCLCVPKMLETGRWAGTGSAQALGRRLRQCLRCGQAVLISGTLNWARRMARGGICSHSPHAQLLEAAMSVKPHAFVAMPFGVKPAPKDPSSTQVDLTVDLIDFNRVYKDYIKAALERAGLEPFRADLERRAGDIIPDMFQELLIADMVVADLTIDNPNVWYELGVRHALRQRGVVIVCGRVTTAFDLYTNRKLIYRLKEWDTDPTALEADISALAHMVKATMDPWHGRKISPVYYHLPNLEEPDWKRLKLGDAKEFWEQHDPWERQIDLARRSRQIADLLVLANEAPVAAFRVDAWIVAGKALRRAGQFKFALEHLEHGIDRSPTNLDLLREKGICLQRLAAAGEQGFTVDRARRHYRDALAQYPRDAETWALLGRVDKDAWAQTWNRAGQTPERKRDDATYEDALLRAAIESYATGYRTNPGHYYSGLNALTLMHLYRELKNDPRYDTTMETMVGAVRFAAQCEPDPDQVFW